MSDKFGVVQSSMGAKLSVVIDKLKPYYAEKNLDALIGYELGDDCTHDLLIKVKEKILQKSRPCASIVDMETRLLDLVDAGKVSRDVLKHLSFSEIVFEDLPFTVESRLKPKFYELLATYQNEYTFGVYESLMADFEMLIRRFKKYDKSPITSVCFTDVFSRHEERVSIQKEARIYIVPTSCSQYSVDALQYVDTQGVSGISSFTVDISLSGIKVSCDRALNKEQVVALRLPSFDDYLPNCRLIPYTVLSSKKIGGKYQVSMKRLESEYEGEVSELLKRLVEKGKLRKSISIGNTALSVKSKIDEQFAMSRSKGMHVFFDESLDMKYTLCAGGAGEVHSWFDLEDGNALTDLLKKDRVQDLVQLDRGNVRECYWVVLKSFTDRTCFYSMLVNDVESMHFAKYAMRSGRGRFFKLSLSGLGGVNPFITSSLPRRIHKQFGDESIYRYSPSAASCVTGLSGLISISEVTNGQMYQLSESVLTDTFKSLVLNLIDGKAVVSSAHDSELIFVESNEFRGEDRFEVNLPLNLTFGGESVKAVALDVSTKGMSVEILSLMGDVDLNVKSLLVSTVGISSYTDRGCEYRVVGRSKRRLHLKLSDGDEKASIIWSEYIDKHIGGLREVGNKESVYGLRRLLRNMVAQRYPTVTAYSKGGDFSVVTRLATSHSVIKSGMSEHDYTSLLKEVMSSEVIEQRIEMDIPEVSRVNPHCSNFVLVKYREGEGLISVNVLRKNDTFGEIFDLLGDWDGKYLVLNISVTNKSKMFDRYFKTELAYLDAYSSVDAKTLVYDADMTQGLIDIIDITDFVEVMPV